MPLRNRPLGPWPTSESMTRRTLGAGAATAAMASADSFVVNAPNGIGRADAVPTIQFVCIPEAAARPISSRASRVFPTPAAPAITTPAYLPTPPSARRNSASTAARPVSASPLATARLSPRRRSLGAISNGVPLAQLRLGVPRSMRLDDVEPFQELLDG